MVQKKALIVSHPAPEDNRPQHLEAATNSQHEQEIFCTKKAAAVEVEKDLILQQGDETYSLEYYDERTPVLRHRRPQK